MGDGDCLHWIYRLRTCLRLSPERFSEGFSYVVKRHFNVGPCRGLPYSSRGSAEDFMVLQKKLLESLTTFKGWRLAFAGDPKIGLVTTCQDSLPVLTVFTTSLPPIVYD